MWPSRSPDLTPCNFFLCGYIKHRVYASSLPRDLILVEKRIEHAVAANDSDVLQRVWQELDFKIAVAHVTEDAHIEHL